MQGQLVVGNGSYFMNVVSGRLFRVSEMEVTVNKLNGKLQVRGVIYDMDTDERFENFDIGQVLESMADGELIELFDNARSALERQVEIAEGRGKFEVREGRSQIDVMIPSRPGSAVTVYLPDDEEVYGEFGRKCAEISIPNFGSLSVEEQEDVAAAEQYAIALAKEINAKLGV